MNATELDANLTGAHANGLAESVENLLIDHARTAFREDELSLEAIGQRLDQVKDSARAARSRIQQRAMLRLERLEARLDRLDADSKNLSAEIRQLEEDRQIARSLLDRGNADQWSEQEMATAAESADKVLIDAAQAIARNKQKIESQLTRRDQLLREQEEYAARENASIELESLLIAGREPQQYEAALANEIMSLTASFAESSEKLNSALTQQRNACLSAESELSVLRAEFDEARKRAYELEAARNLGWLARRLDPRNLLWRSEDAIRKDLAEQQHRLDAAKSDVAEHQAQLEELGRQHESQLALLPEAVRKTMIEEAQREICDTSTLRAENAQKSEESSLKLATQQSDLVLLEGRYADEHQRHVSSYFAEMLRKAESDLENIETCIAAATQLQLRIEKSRKRLSSLIEKRRVKLETDLQECERQESSQINIIEREAQRLRVRLADRAPRAGMIHDRVTNVFRQQESLPNSKQPVRVSYRLIGDELPPVASLAVLLHRREETSYISEHDERLSSVIASILRVDEPAEENRGLFINHFCDIFFGDEQEERTFLISVVSKESNGLMVLVRPSKVLPQLQNALPETMSICVFVRLVYGENRNPENTTLFLLDVALVPDCEARPFERCVALVRHSSRNTLPPASHSLDDLLDQATAHAPVLLDELADRLGDWRGYLGWADEQIFRRAPWAMLGPGELKDSSWEGVIVCESRRTARMFDPESGSPDFRPRFELIQLNAPWRLDGIGTTQLGIRCDRLELIDKDPNTDFLEDCPWGRAAAIAVRLDFKATDSTRLAELAGSAPLALFNVSEVLGSRVQIARYRGALEELQLRVPGGKNGDRLSAAPYLMATLFNVSQAAKPVPKPGRILNPDITRRYRLNADQGAAVEVMLAAPEIAYIQGPPGTGKTTMIAAACAQFVRAGKRVLIASQTNLAVENALERLIGEPEVRPLWLSRTEGEQKKSAAIADWYRMAADHVANAVSNPFRTLSAEVEQLESWLVRSRRLERETSKAVSELEKRQEELRRMEARLTDIRLRQKMHTETSERTAWWTMAHNAISELAEWNPSLFTPVLAPDAAELLRMFAAHDDMAPRLDVSPGALHRQAQHSVRDLQARLRADSASTSYAEAQRIRALILDAWPDVALPSQEGKVQEQQCPAAADRAEAELLRAQQSAEDAQSRADDIHSKTRMLLAELGEVSDLQEVPTELTSAVALVERHFDLRKIRLDDVEPVAEWLPLLDRWVVDLKQQADNPPATDRMGERYVRSANVIGVTCNSNFKILSDSGFPRFDVVIIDEVSKATPLELLRPMLLAPKTVLVGDHRQLPPTFEFSALRLSDQSPTEDEDLDAIEREAELLRKYERLTTASLFRDGFSEINPGARAALYTQYRMHPQIMNLINRFYDGRLQSGLVDPDGIDEGADWSWRMHGLSLNSRTGGRYLQPHLHALWIDSSMDEAGQHANEHSDGTGIGNTLEVRLVAQIVEDIVDACEREKRKKTIAVATFYNRQKRLIRDALKDRLRGRSKNMRIDVETVDRFQGKEADIVIVSMVRNRSPQQGRLGHKSNPAKFERINVAFSRARDLLIVVGARKTFERFEVPIEPVDGGLARPVCVYGQIIDDIRGAGGLWHAKDILGSSSPMFRDSPT